MRFPSFIGALKALEEKGLNIHKVAGSSSGSAIAALYASGMTPEEIQHEILELDTTSFKDFSLKAVIAGKALYSGNVLESWLDTKLNGKRFSDDFRLPIHVITTDILNYKPVIFSAKNFPDVKVSTAVRFSTGMPWVFAYKHFNHAGKKHIFIDGSLMSGLAEETFSKHERTLVLKVISKRTLNHRSSGELTFKRYIREMLNFSINSFEREFLKGGKWKDTIQLFCADISPVKFNMTRDEKEFLFEQGYIQTLKYLNYKWGL